MNATAGGDGGGEPRIVVPADDRRVVRTRDAWLTNADLLARAQSLARRLPDGPGALNLCERREHYLVALLALAGRGQLCLMPPSRAPAVLDEVAAAHPGSFRITDDLVAEATAQAQPAHVTALELNPAHVGAIGYTSGSTGRPKPTPKTWRGFVAPGRCNATSLRRELAAGMQGMQPWIVATVPSQHMYGMECTAILPLFTGMGVHASHPLFPADIAESLADVPAPRVLVSTPVHLRALLESGVDLPGLALVTSATAPLTDELAARVEERHSARVVEFFGSTETCVIASRRTASGDDWRPYPGLVVRSEGTCSLVEAPWLDEPVPMQDIFAFADDGTFRVVGRSADMVEVAGKRTSLADVTRRLLAVPGVLDATVLQPIDSQGAPVRRLVAFVVSPGLAPHEIAAALAGQVDPVFVPRPIVCVERLPRNDVGKLPRERLLELVRRHRLDAG